MDFLLASLLLIVSLVILNYLLISYSRNNYHKYLKVDTNSTKIATKNFDSNIKLEDKVYITCNGLISKPLIVFKSYLANLRTPFSKKANLFIDKIIHKYTSTVNGISDINDTNNHLKVNKNQESKIKNNVSIESNDNFEFVDDHENIITNHPNENEDFISNEEVSKTKNLLDYEKIENDLIARMDKESRDQKFLTALELGDIYGKMGNREEQKEMYLWVLENSSDKSKDMARDRIIAL